MWICVCGPKGTENAWRSSRWHLLKVKTLQGNVENATQATCGRAFDSSSHRFASAESFAKRGGLTSSISPENCRKYHVTSQGTECNPEILLHLFPLPAVKTLFMHLRPFDFLKRSYNQRGRTFTLGKCKAQTVPNRLVFFQTEDVNG